MAKPYNEINDIGNPLRRYPDEKCRWYAVLVKGNYEKKAGFYLRAIKIKVYLPLQKKLRYWSDRKKWIETPLFPCYIFVNVNSTDYYRVLSCPYILKYVSFEGQPAVISQDQISSIKTVLNSGLNYSVITERFKINEQIKLDYGPLSGCLGRIVEFEGKDRLLISIDNVSYNLLVSIRPNYYMPAV